LEKIENLYYALYNKKACISQNTQTYCEEGFHKSDKSHLEVKRQQQTDLQTLFAAQPKSGFPIHAAQCYASNATRLSSEAPQRFLPKRGWGG